MEKKVDEKKNKEVEKDKLEKDKSIEKPEKSIQQITPESVEVAYNALRKIKAIDPSPVILDILYSKQLGCEVYLQLENL